MAGASTLDPDNLPDGSSSAVRKGNDTGSLGPSDSTDSGSDVASGSVMSADELGSDSDAVGTGDRAGVGIADEDAGEPGADVGFDQVVEADDAGLGTGLDEAELARAPDK